MKKFIWTDKLVKDFCKVYTVGAYNSDYKNCKTIETKITKFKQLKTKQNG